MCARVYRQAGAGEERTPFQLIGDGRYHNYTFNWHSGSGTEHGRVDFFVDGHYLGTNNAFAPTRAGRLFIAHWPSPNRRWNAAPNDWGGGGAGSGDENCAMLGWTGTNKWYDATCSAHLRCVCEKPDQGALPPPP